MRTTAEAHARSETEAGTEARATARTGGGAEPDADVVVAGGGPTGLMLAAELALAGVRVRVLERRPSRQRDSRALILHPRSLEVLDLRGIADRFLARGRTVPTGHFAGLGTRLDFSALDSRHGRTLLLAQTHTEELLEERARELGAEVARGHEVTAVRPTGDGAAVEVSARGTAGAYTLRAAYVVGCDGGRSAVREAAGIGFPGTDETLSGMLGDFARTDPDALAAAAGTDVLAVPLGGGVTRFVLVDAERMRVSSREPVTEEEFRAALRRTAGTTFGVGEPRWLSRFGNATRLAATYRAGRVLVAGDAAHVHFPAAGQGLNAGLQDAANLGWKLAAEVAGWAPPGLLDSYDAERRPVGEELTANTRAQTLLFELTRMPAYREAAAALRGVLDGLLRLPEANRHLAATVSGLGTAYPPGDGPGAHPLTGSRVPDVALTTADGTATRVHGLLREGRFALLRLAADGEQGGERDGDSGRDSGGDVGGGRVRAVTATGYEANPRLDGVTELLVRPDGHVAWATGQPAGPSRTAARAQALASWTGTGTGNGAGTGSALGAGSGTDGAVPGAVPASG
ncbi:FAD-dependent monooxygenase [Streptomyces sp. Z26]|uniref:FAD-dependent monooxygenase n=1 Tax=Streptomyces sp. Z26 TaxID=2500177 RepID=UPI0023E86DF3|nr:FAD-dependent monooxygenase [Streptomyces sp. Z26]